MLAAGLPNRSRFRVPACHDKYWFGGQFKGRSQTGALAAAIPAPGPVVSLGLAAVGSKFLYVSDAGGHALNAYSINPSTGALAALPRPPFSLSTFSLPIRLNARPGANALYAADAGGVDGLNINATTGVPTAIPGFPFSSGTNLFLAVDPAGKFLFTSGDDPPGAYLLSPLIQQLVR